MDVKFFLIFVTCATILLLFCKAYEIFVLKETDGQQGTSAEATSDDESDTGFMFSCKKINVAHDMAVFGDSSIYKLIGHSTLNDMRL